LKAAIDESLYRVAMMANFKKDKAKWPSVEQGKTG